MCLQGKVHVLLTSADVTFQHVRTNTKMPCENELLPDVYDYDAARAVMYMYMYILTKPTITPSTVICVAVKRAGFQSHGGSHDSVSRTHDVVVCHIRAH